MCFQATTLKKKVNSEISTVSVNQKGEMHSMVNIALLSYIRVRQIRENVEKCHVV